MFRENHIYEEMQAIAKVLATDPETNDRYDKATKGGREWFCFSRWIAEDRTRWNGRARADYLRGQSPGAPHWTHPDCRLYLEWYNKYDAPTSGLCRSQ